MRTLILTGVGVGPGDPELLTLKAARVLREADIVFAPSTGADKPSRAEEIVRAATGVEVRRLVFALDDTGGVTAQRTNAWDEAGRAVLDAFAAGAAHIAFATLGDPNVYSTFTYLAETVLARRGADQQVRVETVPGITAMQDLAARAGTVLTQGREPLALIPATADEKVLADALSGDGTVVVYKGGRRLGDLLDAVAAAGRSAHTVIGTDLGLPSEQIIRPAEGGAVPSAPYFTTLIAPPPRSADRGGAL